MKLRLRGVTPADVPSILALLEACDLPIEDLEEVDFEHFLVALVDEGDALAGVVGLEPYDTVGLLRSLAVKSRYRGRSVARALVEALEHRARREGIEELFLLTTTAADYFSARGFDPVDRSSAPEAIRRTREFAEICPGSAAFMRKRVG